MRVVRAPVRFGGGVTYRYQDFEGLLANEDADITMLGDLSTRVAANEEYSAYLHDDWRVAPSLTLNVGMRYEYFGPTRELDDRARVLDLSSFEYQPVHGGFYKTSHLGFAPRFGAAWAPTRLHGRTVFRLGGGIFQGAYSMLDTLQPIENDADRYVVIGGSFPITAEEIASAEGRQISPLVSTPAASATACAITRQPSRSSRCYLGNLSPRPRRLQVSHGTFRNQGRPI